MASALHIKKTSCTGNRHQFHFFFSFIRLHCSRSFIQIETSIIVMLNRCFSWPHCMQVGNRRHGRLLSGSYHLHLGTHTQPLWCSRGSMWYRLSSASISLLSALHARRIHV